jgi:peptidyl-tRNA hydrolase, PTH1 family
MRVICGLGNPGLRYRNTWHNLGFILVDRLADAAGVSFRSGRGAFMETRIQLGGEDVLLIKPTTYMNLSGQALREACQFYQVPFEDTLVVLDDMELPLGEIRFRASGSGGNHNGLGHIVQICGKETPRLRLGFRPLQAVDSTSWKRFVLATIPQALFNDLDEMLENAQEGIGLFLEKGLSKAMNRFNQGGGRRKSAKPTEKQGDGLSVPDTKTETDSKTHISKEKEQ